MNLQHLFPIPHYHYHRTGRPKPEPQDRPPGHPGGVPGQPKHAPQDFPSGHTGGRTNSPSPARLYAHFPAPPALPPPARGHPGCRPARPLLENMGCSCGGFLTATTGPHPVRHSVGRHVFRRDLRSYSPNSGPALPAPSRPPVSPGITARYGTIHRRSSSHLMRIALLAHA